MAIDWWTFGLQTVNFLVLVWLLQRFLYRPVLAAVDRRRAETLAARDKAAAAERRAETAEAAWRARMAAAEADLAERRRRAEAEGAGRGEAIVAAARLQAERLLAEARRSLAEERRQSVADLRAEAAAVAGALAARLLAVAAPGVGPGPFLAALLARLGGLGPEERAALAGGPLIVETAPPLDAAGQEDWGRRLAAVLGVAGPLRFAASPALIAGARLVGPAAVLTVSWAEALAAAEREMGHAEAG